MAICYAIFAKDMGTEEIIAIKRHLKDCGITEGNHTTYNYYFMNKNNLTPKKVKEDFDFILAGAQLQDVDVIVFFVGDIITFSCINVSPDKKMIYYRNQDKLRNVLSCFTSGVPEEPERTNTILDAFFMGDLNIEDCILSEKEHIISVLSQCATENGISITNQGISMMAEALKDAGIRSIGSKGTVAIEGEVSCVSPRMIAEVKKIIG